MIQENIMQYNIIQYNHNIIITWSSSITERPGREIDDTGFDIVCSMIFRRYLHFGINWFGNAFHRYRNISFVNIILVNAITRLLNNSKHNIKPVPIARKEQYWQPRALEYMLKRVVLIGPPSVSQFMNRIGSKSFRASSISLFFIVLHSFLCLKKKTFAFFI
jgi:hypothetical protein